MLTNALIVGGGIAGMCAAIQLRKAGVAVDLVEVDPNWRPEGAGITLLGPTLRALTDVGVIDDVMERGYCADDLDLFNAEGTKIAQIPTIRVGRSDIPGGGGILRPVLADILRAHTLASGARVDCGVSLSSATLGESDVRVLLSNGEERTYDLLVGADGLRSELRATLFPDAPTPHYTGQGSWRAVVARPPSVVRAAMFMGHKIKAGVNPVSKSEMYLFVTEPRETAEHIGADALTGVLRGLLSEFSGVIGTIRDSLDSRSRILYRPFWALLKRPPWHRGRAVLIGDAVHATTPHLASGAGIGVEDAVVLAQELSRRDGIEPALERFTHRRFERCRAVVENSLRLGEIERLGGSKQEHEQLMRDSMSQLRAAY